MPVTIKRDNNGKFVSLSKQDNTKLTKKRRRRANDDDDDDKKKKKKDKKKRKKRKKTTKKHKKIYDDNDKTEIVETKTENNNNIVYGRIHAGWCGHCVSMTGDWVKLQKMHPDKTCWDIEEKEQDKQVTIFNNTYNPVPVLNKAFGFPYIFKFKSDTKQIIQYNGARDLNSMDEWLRGGG
jgi:thiol-disulfide isomerase/thioredoxin|tara:strand:- start:878 stop:1417 length:540 start_codon:yes stop_codon:yes gene_type:complete